MDYLDLTDDFLKEAEQTMCYDPNIPLQYRIIAKLNDSDISSAKRFIEANIDDLQDKYAYLVLDSAVELCLNIVIDENGVIYDKETKHNLSKGHIYKPAPIELKYIEYLLQMGFDPYLPEYFDQYEHIEDLEDDCSHQRGVQFDLSDVKKLFDKYQKIDRKGF